MRPPRIRTLQLLNACIGGGQYLAIANATGTLSREGWTPWQVGVAVMASQACYMAFVNVGGRLSDRWGRARTASLGSAICTVGVGIGLALDDPFAAAVAICLGCLGAAFFFPGNVGLFSDAQGDDGAAPPPLHRKVSGYNLGWSGGNLAGFGLALLLSGLPLRVGWAACVLLSIIPLIVLWPLRALPPHAPQAQGDRAPHPALGHLTWMGRGALLIFCLIGMSFIGLLENCLTKDGMPQAEAHRMAAGALFAYALGYFGMFFVLGRWSGWVLRPWRLLALQSAFVVAAIGVLLLSRLPAVELWQVAGLGILLGIGYAAVYTGSIYYSLRLPEGAARAAALHETALGIGSTVGPPLCGALIALWGTGSLAGLGSFMVAVAALCVLMQAVLIPRAVRLGAHGPG